MKDYSYLIGKRISVSDPRGGTPLGGVCSFAGINSLHGTFQVTIDRSPVWPVDPKTIKIIEDGK